MPRLLFLRLSHHALDKSLLLQHNRVRGCHDKKRSQKHCDSSEHEACPVEDLEHRCIVPGDGQAHQVVAKVPRRHHEAAGKPPWGCSCSEEQLLDVSGCIFRTFRTFQQRNGLRDLPLQATAEKDTRFCTHFLEVAATPTAANNAVVAATFPLIKSSDIFANCCA